MGSRGEGEFVAKRVKLVAELRAGVTTGVEVGRLERDERARVADLGLRLGEAKQITAALQAEMDPATPALLCLGEVVIDQNVPVSKQTMEVPLPARDYRHRAACEGIVAGW